MVERKIQSIQSGFSFRSSHLKNIRPQANLDGGAAMDVDSFCADISRKMAGKGPEMAQAIAHWSASGLDEQVMGTVDCANGLMANFDCAFTLARRELLIAAATKRYNFVPTAFLPGKVRTTRHEFLSNEESQPDFAGSDEDQQMLEPLAEYTLMHPMPLNFTPITAANMREIKAFYRSARSEGAWRSVIPLT